MTPRHLSGRRAPCAAHASRPWTLAALLSAVLLVLSGCDPAPDTSLDGGTTPAPDASFDGGAVTPDEGVPFALTTPAFENGAAIPLRYECSPAIGMGPGENISPMLEWTSPVAEAGSLALVMDDVDSGVVHWVVYDIPPSVRGLDEDVRAAYMLATPAGARQAELQGTGYFGYFGPCSPASTNTYRWTLHVIATPTLVGASMGSTEYELVDLIQAQSIESASFSGES